MIELSTSIVVDAPPAVVWADLSDIAAHAEWMADVVDIRFITASKSGVGTTYEVDTRFGPFRLGDRLEISEWVPLETIAVRRGGVVGGEGRFGLEEVPEHRTRLTRDMRIDFPWWMGGPAGERVAVPILRSLFRSSLRAFAARHARGT